MLLSASVTVVRPAADVLRLTGERDGGLWNRSGGGLITMQPCSTRNPVAFSADPASPLDGSLALRSERNRALCARPSMRLITAIFALFRSR